MLNPSSPLPWHVRTLGTPDPFDNSENKDKPAAELRDSLGRTIAVLPDYKDAEFILSLFDEIKELEDI